MGAKIVCKDTRYKVARLTGKNWSLLVPCRLCLVWISLHIGISFQKYSHDKQRNSYKLTFSTFYLRTETNLMVLMHSEKIITIACNGHWVIALSFIFILCLLLNFVTERNFRINQVQARLNINVVDTPRIQDD